MNTLTRVSMYVDESEYKCLGAISKVTGTPVAGLVRQAIDQWLRRCMTGRRNSRLVHPQSFKCGDDYYESIDMNCIRRRS